MTNDNFWNDLSQYILRLEDNIDPIEISTTIDSILSKKGFDIYCHVSRNFKEIPTEVIFYWKQQVVNSLLKNSPHINNWSFLAQDEWLGFDFSMEINWIIIRALELKFNPLESAQLKNVLWIRIYSNKLLGVENNTFYADKILRTGLGNLANVIKHVEIVSENQENWEELSFSKLKDYIEWKQKK